MINWWQQEVVFVHIWKVSKKNNKSCLKFEQLSSKINLYRLVLDLKNAALKLVQESIFVAHNDHACL